jgi:threonine/homoserine/homoserine lactone efflux protein
MTHHALSPTLAVFLLASLVLAVTPGPGVIYLVTRTLAGGRRAGLASVGGVALGNLGNAALASACGRSWRASRGLSFIALGLVVACSDTRSAR